MATKKKSTSKKLNIFYKTKQYLKAYDIILLFFLILYNTFNVDWKFILFIIPILILLGISVYYIKTLKIKITDFSIKLNSFKKLYFSRKYHDLKNQK